jgi:hypothetical protein
VLFRWHSILSSGLISAILFDSRDSADATIGHYCTIVEVHPTAFDQFSEEPTAWRYRVYVPNQDAYCEVEHSELLGLDEFDNSPFPPEDGPFEVHMIAQPGDNEQIAGKYRFGRQPFQQFLFLKRAQPKSTYELRRPVYGGELRGGELLYYVPRERRLDHSYVLRKLSKLFRRTDEPVVVNECPPRSLYSPSCRGDHAAIGSQSHATEVIKPQDLTTAPNSVLWGWIKALIVLLILLLLLSAVVLLSHD